MLAPYDPASLVLADRHTYEVAANWKVIAENYHECYHCPLIHPELCQVTPPDSGDNYDLPGAWVGGGMVLRDGMATMSLTGRWRRRRCRASNPTAVEYLHLLPNLLVSAHPDYVMTHRMVPLAPDRTWVECSWLIPPAAPARARRRGGVLGHHQPPGLGGLRVGPARAGVAALPAGAVRAAGGRRGPAGLDDRLGVPLGRAVGVTRRVGLLLAGLLARRPADPARPGAKPPPVSLPAGCCRTPGAARSSDRGSPATRRPGPSRSASRSSPPATRRSRRWAPWCRTRAVPATARPAPPRRTPRCTGRCSTGATCSSSTSAAPAAPSRSTARCSRT